MDIWAAMRCPQEDGDGIVGCLGCYMANKSLQIIRATRHLVFLQYSPYISHSFLIVLYAPRLDTNTSQVNS